MSIAEVPTCMDGRKAFPSTAIDASNAVVVVPTFDPSVNGYALSTEMTPRPINGVILEVNTELDWTKKVITAPTSIAR